MTAASSTKSRKLKTINPATEEVIKTYELLPEIYLFDIRDKCNKIR